MATINVPQNGPYLVEGGGCVRWAAERPGHGRRLFEGNPIVRPA
jgi:hypothetical protein